MKILFLIIFLMFPKLSFADFSAKIGSFTLTATGSKSISSVGFQPKVIIFFGDRSTSRGNIVDARQFWGVATNSSSEWTISYADMGGVVTSDNGRSEFTDACISMTSSADGGHIKSDFTSMDADGFTINVSELAASSDVFYIALGGSDLSAKVSNFNIPNTTGSKSITSVGFQPELVMLGNTIPNTTTGENLANYVYMLSAATGAVNEAVTQTIGIDAVNPSQVDSIQRTDRFIRREGTTGVAHSADFTSMDADGFTYNLDTTNANTPTLGYLALTGVEFKVGSFDQKTSTGIQSVTGVGFQPSIVMFLSSGKVSGTTLTADNSFMFGVATSSSSEAYSIGATQDNISAVVANRRSSTTKALGSLTPGTPTVTSEADFTSMDTDGFTINWSTADATAREIIYIAIGAVATSNKTTINDATINAATIN